MYEIIPAEERHLKQIIALLATTGYWSAGFKHNALDIQSMEFMYQFVAKPNLPFTHILVNQQNNNTVLGVVVCASKKEISNMPDYSAYMAPQIAK
ncbi:MAG: hypothetical protein ACK4PR_14195, partial [Gammaproteobacteria bacterium]